MRIGLRTKFCFFFFIIGAAMLALCWMKMIMFITDIYLEDEKKTLKITVELLAESQYFDTEKLQIYAETKTKDQPYWITQKKLESIRERTDFAYIYVIFPTAEDTAIWIFNTTENGPLLGEPVTEYGTEKYQTARSTYHTGDMQYDSGVLDENGKEMFSIYYPIQDESGKAIAILGADMFLDDIAGNIADHFLSIILYIIIVIVAGMLLLLLFVQFAMIRPISLLKHGVKRMAEGELDIRVGCRKKDEIGEITDVFNRMSSNIGGHIRQVEELNHAYQKFIPPETFEMLQKDSVVDIRLGDQNETDLTVLSIEPCRFLQKAGNMSSEETFHYINSILKKLIPEIHDQGGTIMQFEKAGIRAFYRNDTESALKSAVIACERAGSRGEPISAGIARGTVMLGIVGQEERMDIISISSQKKMSELLMQLAPRYHASILISGDAAEQIPGFPLSYHCRFLGYLKIGLSQKLERVYDVYDGDMAEDRRLKQKTQKLFEQGVGFFCEGNYSKARQVFIDVLRGFRRDDAAREYLYRCSRYLEHGEKAGNIWLEEM